MKILASARRSLYATVHRKTLWLHRIWPSRIQDPIFLVGCPRSGTSILGQILSADPSIRYLYEPRYIWSNLDPHLDIWNYKYPIREGVLVWDETDYDARVARKLARWFAAEQMITRKDRLVEKTPENTFRMLWLSSLFPDARFIHIIRNGVDVALSLQKALARWFPQGYWETSRHYGIFRDYAASHPDLCERLGFITEGMDNYPRGLLVWACSILAGKEMGSKLGSEKYIEIRYEALIQDAKMVLDQIYGFTQTSVPNQVLEYANSILSAESLGKTDPNFGLTTKIAGDILTQLNYR